MACYSQKAFIRDIYSDLDKNDYQTSYYKVKQVKKELLETTPCCSDQKVITRTDGAIRE